MEGYQKCEIRVQQGDMFYEEISFFLPCDKMEEMKDYLREKESFSSTWRIAEKAYLLGAIKVVESECEKFDSEASIKYTTRTIED